jgi:hypothetical protein
VYCFDFPSRDVEREDVEDAEARRGPTRRTSVLPSREYDGWMSIESPKVSWVLRVGSDRSTEKIFQVAPTRRL